jgi:Flp pilus assembly protein TadG
VVFLLLLGALDLGLALITKERLDFAVEAGARYGAAGANPLPSDADTATYAAAAAGLPGLDSTGFRVTKPTCGVSVSTSYVYDGLKVLPSITLGAGACYPLVVPPSPPAPPSP